MFIGLIPVVIGSILPRGAAPTEINYDEFGNLTRTGGDSGLAAVGGLLIGLGVLDQFLIGSGTGCSGWVAPARASASAPWG